MTNQSTKHLLSNDFLDLLAFKLWNLAPVANVFVVCYYNRPFWPNLVKEFEKVLKYAVFSHTL